jgi:hypothetical protein
MGNHMHLVTPIRDGSGGVTAHLEFVNDSPDPRHVNARMAAREFRSVMDAAANNPGVLPVLDHLGRSVEAPGWAALRTRESLLRLRGVTDAAEVESLRVASDSAYHNRLRLFAYGRACARIEGGSAQDAGRAFVARGWGKHVETIHDAATASAVYPGLIAQLAIREIYKLPVGNFERCFPRVAPAANLMPGITHYQVARSSGRGQSAPIANGQKEKFNIFSMGQETALRWTAFHGLVVEEHYIAQLQSSLPGQPVMGLDDVIVESRLAMSAASNKMQWGGAGPGKVGFLDMEEVAYKSAGTLPADTSAMLKSITLAIGEIMSSTKGNTKPNMMIISMYLVGKLLAQLEDGAGGLIDNTALNFLREKIGKAIGIDRIEIAWELDNLRAPDATTTNIDVDSNYCGIWIGSDEAVQRVDILPTTMLPIVQGSFVQSVPMIAQIGQPYHVSYQPSVMIRWAKA